MRLLLLALGLTATSLAANAPAELSAALQKFRADPPVGWSYTQTTSAEGKSTVERHDAARPVFDRWSLRQKDGRTPTPEEAREYIELRSRRSRGGTAPKLAEQLDPASAEIVGQDAGRTTYRCQLKPAEKSDDTAAFLRATVVVHTPTGAIESIELSNIDSFRPTFGVKIAEMKTRMTYSLPTDGQPSLPQRVETRVRGTAFWFKTLDAELSVVFSDYARATKP